MGTLGFLVVLAGIVGAVVALTNHVRQQQADVVARVAHYAGWRVETEGGMPLARGQLQGLPCSLGHQFVGGSRYQVAIVDLPKGPLDAVQLVSGRNRDETTGDPAFDKRYALRSKPYPGAHAVFMDERVRELMDGFDGKVEVHNGRLVLFFRAEFESLKADLKRLGTLARVLDTASRMSDEAGRLHDIARSDPALGVRLRAAELLLEHFHQGEHAQRFLTWARASSDTGVFRLFAAKIDGNPRGVPAVLDVLRGGWSALWARHNAIVVLMRWKPQDAETLRTLETMARIGSGELLRGILELFEAYERCPALETVKLRLTSVGTNHQLQLLRLLPLAEDGPEACLIARPYLFAKDSSLAEAACVVFASRGGIDAVEMLHGIASSERRPGDVRAAARKAIVKIQTRSGRSPSHGGLMLSDEQPREGALSTTPGGVVGTRRGQLEVAEETEEALEGA